jgi:hypothetical protein
MTSLCATFEALAERTWHYLDAAQQTEIRIGEETLTDINLIDIQRRHEHEVLSVKFTRAQESKNGADWEWWFLWRGYAYGFRLQAKKLYPKFAYTSLYGDGRTQATTLLTTAIADDVVPLYCFYNYEPNSDSSDWPGLPARTPIEQMGCAIAPAQAVEAEVVGRRASPTIERLAPYEEPWRVLACSFGGADDNQADDESSGSGGDDEGPDSLGDDDSPGSSGGDEPRGSDEDDEAPGGPLEDLRAWAAERLSDYDATAPDIRSAANLPEYVRFVATQEGRAYSGEVPARRVTVFRLDGYS